MREPKKPVEIDLLKPINAVKYMDDVIEEDCFGKEWSAKAAECHVCGVEPICAVVFSKLLKEREKKLSEKNGPYLDEAVLMTPNQLDQLESSIKNRHSKGAPAEVAEVFEVFKFHMKTKDDKAVKKAMVDFIKSRANLYTREGFCYHKNVSDEK